QRTQSAVSAPGPARPIVVKRWGGDMVIGGVSVFVVDKDLRPFEDGTELLLILNSANDGKYRIAGGVAGALPVKDGKILPSNNRALKEPRWVGMTIEQVESEVRRLAR